MPEKQARFKSKNNTAPMTNTFKTLADKLRERDTNRLIEEINAATMLVMAIEVFKADPEKDVMSRKSLQTAFRHRVLVTSGKSFMTADMPLELVVYAQREGLSVSHTKAGFIISWP